MDVVLNRIKSLYQVDIAFNAMGSVEVATYARILLRLGQI